MAKSSVIGIDLGASSSLVAYVGKGVVDLVQNEVSNRATPSLVGFTDRERLLGDSALAQIRSNAKNTCRNFKHLLGRDVSASDIEKEHFWSMCPLAEAEDGAAGYDVTYKGASKVVSAVPVTAMFLTRLKDITEKWCQAKVADAVISVPAFFSDAQRQALLDAAKIAGISVLRVMNEHTATALAYGIYRSNDFDPEKPMTVAFCSMGHSIFSVSIVQFVRGKLNVLCEKSDKVGGRDMDECLMRAFAEQFKKKHGCDPLSSKKALYKLEDAVTKTKKVLSANSEATVNVECLMEDEDFASNMNRADFESMCQPMMDRVKAVLEGAKAMCSVPVEQIDIIEVVGGASRVPWWKAMCSQAFGGKELSTTMNADESVARGCALQAAILSPLYKVRDFKVEDTTLVGVSIGWAGTAVDPSAPKEEDGDTPMIGGDAEYKVATLFPAGSMMNMLKMLTFYRNGPFELKAQFADDGPLLPKSKKELGTYRIEVPAQTEPQKIKVRAKMSLNGLFTIEGAQLLVEHEYEETVKEKREVEAATEGESKAEGEKAPGDTPEGEQNTAADNTTDKKDADKKFEMVDVVKKRTRITRTDLVVTATGRPGLPADVIQKKIDEETKMQSEMRDILETDEKRNDLESYIFNTRDKITESGEYGAYVSGKDRDKFNALLQKAEDWLYDAPDATRVQYIDKLVELRETGDAVVWRWKEAGMREEWIRAIQGTVINYRQAAENPGDKYGHISADKRGKIASACKDLEKWLGDKKAAQEKLPKSDKPVLVCAEMERRNQELSKMANEILKEAKPPPPKPPPKVEKPIIGSQTSTKEEEKKPEASKEESKDEKKAEAPKDEAATEESPPKPREPGPQNMDVD